MSCYQVRLQDGTYLRFASHADYYEWRDLRNEYYRLLDSDADEAPAAVEEVLSKKNVIEERGRNHRHV